MDKKFWMTELQTKEDLEYSYEIHPTDIAEALFKLLDGSYNTFVPDTTEKEQVIDMLYDLYSCACNDYNKEGFRTMYKLLATLAFLTTR